MSVLKKEHLLSRQGDCREIGQLLHDAESEIVRLWLASVAERVSLEGITPEERENAIRRFLQQLRRRILAGDERPALCAVEHGVQRFEIGYELAAMLNEYSLLLDSIEQVAEHQGVRLTMASYSALARHIIAASAEAVLAFVDEERAQRQEQSNRQFAFIAHEIRNPLQNLRLALDAWGHGGDPQRLHPLMNRAVGNIRQVVDQRLVEAQQLANGATAILETTQWGLTEFIQEVLAENAPFAEMRNIQLRSEAPSAFEVSLDRALLWSALNNLVRNAIKFSRLGGCVVVRSSDVVPARPDSNNRFSLQVEDECGGLEEGVAEAMFVPFKQFDSDRSGFGLGLSIARQAIEAHRGTIEVRSTDHGCVFTVELPIRYEP